MVTFRRVHFETSIVKASNGYRIWIPKHIWKEMPPKIWVIENTIIKSDGFKQSLINHPLSRAGKGFYVPIYAQDIEADYSAFGKVNVEMVYDLEDCRCQITRGNSMSMRDGRNTGTEAA